MEIFENMEQCLSAIGSPDHKRMDADCNDSSFMVGMSLGLPG